MKQLEILRLKELIKEIGIIADKLLSEYQTPVETLGLSGRLKNSLKRNGVDFIEQVLKMSEKDLLKMQHFGNIVLKN